jgi:hypothetical protein
MKPARLFGHGSVTIELQICDVALEPLSVCMTAVRRLQRFGSARELTKIPSLHWGTLIIFRKITGGPGNSVH